MADLLTHVLVAYVLLTVVGWRVEWVTERWVVVGMCGAVIPDLNRLALVVDETPIQATLGVPYSFDALHTLLGVLLIAGAVAALFDPGRRAKAYAVLVAGGLSHLVVDGWVIYADDRAGFLWYPLWWRPPTPNLYVSADPLVPATALVIAGLVFGIDRGVLRRPRGDE